MCIRDSTVYADQLREEDDVIFDNRDLLFNLQNDLL